MWPIGDSVANDGNACGRKWKWRRRCSLTSPSPRSQTLDYRYRHHHLHDQGCSESSERGKTGSDCLSQVYLRCRSASVATMTTALEWHFGGGSAFTFSNVLLMLWCLCSNACPAFGRATTTTTTTTHRRAPFCDDRDAEATVDQPMSFLWAIKRDPPSYFFGTIHVPYTRVWDYIPENTKRAFEVSEQVFFELDLTDPYTISALTQCQLLPHGKNLSEVLPRDIYRRLKRHLDYVRLVMPTWLTSDQRDRGLYADYLFNVITGNWERKRPVWVMLMVNSLTESDIKSRGIPVLDLYLAQEAERRNKKTGAVEEVEEQCVPLNGLDISQVVFALNQTLDQQERVRAGGAQAHYTTDDLIKHYNCGDLNTVIFNQDTTQVPTLVNSTLPPMDVSIARKIDDYFRRELICKRNKRMGERVMELLVAHPSKSFFFAFGAGHFLGNYTVLDVVQNMGFEVEHIAANQKIKPHKTRTKPMRVQTIPELSLLKEFSSNSLDEDDEQPGLDEESEETGRRVFGTSFLSSGGARRRPKKMHKTKKNAVTSPLFLPLSPSSASSSSSSSSAGGKRRNFNDLWVRLDQRTLAMSTLMTTTTRSPKTLPREKPSEETLAVQRSLRVWYGLPNVSEATAASFANGHLCLPLLALITSRLLS